ncbi:eEF1-gamma domain-containing protein [Exidia glandulosa HHB12029]|uniref:EEF1-gamma domain-containing protein n=1 Tax=Exidia glandulosa HHB12029 TaxID=1314781 RepID=A0A165GTE2_EXIGL|nr:eEF1-gamma domain-containing protein [Exidia glandulosa HHB12029]
MAVGTLYEAYPHQPGAVVIKAVAAITGQELDFPAQYKHFETNKTPEFVAKFPHGKVPAFEGKDGFKLFEGIAIARYLAAKSGHKTLLGATVEEAALVDQWISFTATELGTNLGNVRAILAHRIPYNKVLETTLRDNGDRALATIDKHLLSHTYIASHRLTVADLLLASVLHGAFAFYIDASKRSKFPNLQRYYETVINQKGVKGLFAETQYVEKAQTYAPPAKEEKKKEEKPKAEKPKEPKAEKPKKAAEEDDDDEPSVPAEPKVKNPLDDLPKSAFNLEDWKRAYSNMDTRGAGGAIEWFYEKFDPQGFSVWRVDFKYNSELTQVFMSSNQIGGFFNRLEGSRKYLFGSMGVLGTTGDSIISGVLILRGSDYKPVVEVAPDWESYAYQELHVTGPNANAEEKKFFEAALAWDLEIDGKKWADGKNFK